MRARSITAAVAALTLLAPAAAHGYAAGTDEARDLRALFGQQMLGVSMQPEPVATTRAASEPPLTAVPRPSCGAGSRPETGIQGRVPAGADAGFTCNTELVSREGQSGGFKVRRFVDRAGHACAFYDTTLLFPSNAQSIEDQPTGVAVVDMTDPAKPVRTDTLMTPAMQTPHESLVLNEKRGLLVAVMGNPTLYPGFVDIYDVNADCRHPALQSSLPVGLLGHESGFAPDGKTFYATSLFNGSVTAVDVTDPKAPAPVWVGNYRSHGLTVSDDGNRAYLAALEGLIILDTSEVQARKPNPQVREISRLVWSSMSIPQVALPVTIDGKKYLVEVDEFATSGPGQVVPEANGPQVGAARIIDISDEKAPRVVSNIRLAVNNREHRAALAGDPGNSSPAQGYAGHYCNVPKTTDPGIVACSFIASGLRVFDIRDPLEPRELGYYVAPGAQTSNYAMSGPDFVPSRGEIWYSDGNSGFYAVRMTNGTWPFPSASLLASQRTCKSRRSFTIRIRAPRGQRLQSVSVDPNFGRATNLKRNGSGFRATIDLRGVPSKRSVTVRVRARTHSGKTVVQSRRYKTCTRRA